MRIQWMKFPVTCPTCGQEFLSALRVAEVNLALRRSRPLELYASCHDQRWSATDYEVQQIRQYADAVQFAGLRHRARPSQLPQRFDSLHKPRRMALLKVSTTE
jgi:hypothetical protein